MTGLAPSSSTANASATPTRPCPACGAEWPDEIRYCGECGGRMPDATLVAAPYKVQVEATDVANAAPIIGPMSEALVPTLVPDAPLEAGPPAPDLLDVERLEASAHATALMVPPSPDPNTLAQITTLDTSVIGEAWRIVSSRVGPMAVGTLIVSLASSALSSTLVGLIALGPVQGGFSIAGLRAASGRSVTVNDFFDGFASFDLAKRLAITGLLVTLATSLGLMLFIVPGLYAMMAFSYAPLLVVDRGLQPLEALRLSFEQVNARFGTHCAIFALLGAIVLAGSLVCGVGLLVAMPVAFVAVALCYERVFGIRDGVDKLR